MPPNEPDKTPPPRGADAAPTAAPTRLTIGLFAKHWTPGATKTRLAARLGDANAAAVSRLFFEATLQRLSTLDAPLALARRLAVTPAEAVASFESAVAAAPCDWAVTAQATGDLGARMRGLFSAVDGPLLLMGSDTPHFPMAAVQQAISRIATPAAQRRVALAPCDDGGYWLVASSGGPPPIFEGMPWSESDLFAATEQRLLDSGWRLGVDYHRLAKWYDIDEPPDLVRMRRELAAAPALDSALSTLRERLDELLGPID
ncbi:DUF2064 domain-containing protein [Botrimarina sp.]|uniref:TIGR04282 family arsenosugar biosynthesis glycosyltransferase n=1 Tax=Botrimarina sp. TaxID=2795802 RepID=UPI0032EB3387